MATASKPLKYSLREYGRGVTGGLLFSLPMLYTMELWWAGFIAKPLQLMLYLLIGFFLLMIYNRYVGMRPGHSFWEGVLESLEELGLGMLLTILVLWVTGRISPLMSISEISGKVIVEAVTVAIGISVGKSQLGSDNDDEEDEVLEEQKQLLLNPDITRAMGLALCGTVLVASNVAPTEEILVIAMESEYHKLLGVALISMAIGGGVLYFMNFTGTERIASQPSQKWMALLGTVIMYAIALLSSAFMLWFFGRFDGQGLEGIIAQTVILGFPAALGASAGRLLIQT